MTEEPEENWVNLCVDSLVWNDLLIISNKSREVIIEQTCSLFFRKNLKRDFCQCVSALRLKWGIKWGKRLDAVFGRPR
jgi:hypothetical protein